MAYDWSNYSPDTQTGGAELTTSFPVFDKDHVRVIVNDQEKLGGFEVTIGAGDLPQPATITFTGVGDNDEVLVDLFHMPIQREVDFGQSAAKDTDLNYLAEYTAAQIALAPYHHLELAALKGDKGDPGDKGDKGDPGDPGTSPGQIQALIDQSLTAYSTTAVTNAARAAAIQAAIDALSIPEGGLTQEQVQALIDVSRTYRGDWTATATYSKGDIVARGIHEYWMATRNVQANGSMPGRDNDLWRPVTNTIQAFTNENQYETGDIVTYDGEVWISVVDVNSATPGTNPAEWRSLTAQPDVSGFLELGAIKEALYADLVRIKQGTNNFAPNAANEVFMGTASFNDGDTWNEDEGILYGMKYLDSSLADALGTATFPDLPSNSSGVLLTIREPLVASLGESRRGVQQWFWPAEKNYYYQRWFENRTSSLQAFTKIESLLSGSAVPANALGSIGNLYVRTGATPTLYVKTANTTWTQVQTGGGAESIFKGAYSSTTTYNQGDIVATSAQRYWLCTTDGTVGISPTSEAQRWHSLSEWQGPWSSSVAPYPVGVFVVHNGHVWVNTWANNSAEPGTAGDTNNRWRNITDMGSDNIHTGTTEPAGTLGAVGDIYARTGGTPQLYVKTDTTTWTEISAPAAANAPQTLVNWGSVSGSQVGHLQFYATPTAAHIDSNLALTSEDDDKTLRIEAWFGVGQSATHISSDYIEMSVGQFRSFANRASNSNFSAHVNNGMRSSMTINGIGSTASSEAHVLVSKQNDGALLFGSSEISNLYIYSLKITLLSHRGVQGPQGPAGADGDSHLPPYTYGDGLLRPRALMGIPGRSDNPVWNDVGRGAVRWYQWRDGENDKADYDRLIEVAPNLSMRRHSFWFTPAALTGGFTGYKTGVGGSVRIATTDIIPDLSVWGNGLIGSATIDQVSWSTTQNETVISFTPDVEQDLQAMAHSGVRIAIAEYTGVSGGARVAYDKALIDGQVAGGLIVFGETPNFNDLANNFIAFYLYRKEDETVATIDEIDASLRTMAANKRVVDLANPSAHQGLTEVALNDFVRVNNHDFTNPIGKIKFQGSTGAHNSYNYYGYLSSSVWHPGVSGFGTLLSDPEMTVPGFTGDVRLRRFTQDGRNIRISFNVDESDLIAAGPDDLRWVLYDPANDSIIAQAPFSIGATTDDEQVYEHLLFEDILPSGISSTYLQGKTLEVAIFVRRDPIDSVSELKPVVVRRQALTPEEWSQHVSLWNASKKGSGVVEELTITSGAATNGAHGYWSSNYLGGGSGSNGSTTDSSLDLSKLTRDGTGATKTVDALLWSTLKHVVVSFTDQTESDFLPNFHYDLRMALVHGEQVLFDDAFTNADVILPGTNGEAISWVHAVPNPFPDGAVIKALFYRSPEALDLDHIRNGALTVPHTPTTLMDFVETGTEVEKAANQLHIVGPSWERQPTADDDGRFLKIWASISSNGAGNDTVVCHGEVPVDYWRAGSEHADASSASAVNFRVSLTPAYGTGGGTSAGLLWRRPYVGKITGGRLGIGCVGNSFYIHKARVVLV